MLTKRGPGRPPRPKSLSVVLGQGGPKRGPGRPPRSGPRGVVAGVKPRGRPKKDGSSTVKRPGRPRGRPLKIVAVAVGSGGDAAAGLGPLSNDGKVLPGKRRGRPPMAAGPKMPRKFTGKPLGRPRKVYGCSDIPMGMAIVVFLTLLLAWQTVGCCFGLVCPDVDDYMPSTS
ncbi:unnamed protein product [Ilex paraguariensis]|uniref:Uncharacterized protein n=1 Tax=Ilex paraguariensis TaxID=185542 RepID=A0ABC8RA58_9AQUA